MSLLLRRGADQLVHICLQATPSFSAQQLLQKKLGARGLRFTPAELLASHPPAGDALICCIAGSPSAQAAGKVLACRIAALPASGYRIETRQVRGGRVVLVVGGDLFGLLAGLADLCLHSELNGEGLTYRGGDKKEIPAIPLRFYWTWDHSTNWVLDDEGNQVEGCNNRYLKKPETFLEDYRRLVDHCIEMRFNAIVIWGFLRDSHGGEAYSHEVCRYAADRGVAILPGVGTTGYGGIYYEGDHPCNLETHLAAHPQLGNTGSDGVQVTRESSPYYPENQQWIARSLTWLYQSFPIGGVNLENNDMMVDFSKTAARARAKIRSGEPDHFKDQYFAYKTALEVAQKLAPNAWNTYATYCGFNRGNDINNAGASMGNNEPYFATRMPPSAIAQWTITGMVLPQPAPLRAWMQSPRPKQVLENERWPQGLGPPTPRSAGFLHQASQWSRIRRPSPAMSTFAEGALRCAEEGLEGISVHGEVTGRALAWRLNYLTMRHWCYHPQSTLEQFAVSELAPRLGSEQAARDFVEALCLFEENQLDAAGKIAVKRRREAMPYPYPKGSGNAQHYQLWRELLSWVELRLNPQWAPGFSDLI